MCHGQRFGSVHEPAVDDTSHHRATNDDHAARRHHNDDRDNCDTVAPTATWTRSGGSLTAMDIDRLVRERLERDDFLIEHYSSPLPEEHRSGFGGLDYFPPDGAWALIGEYHPATRHKVPVPSSVGTESSYTMLGVMALTIGDSAYRLTVLDDGDGGAFIPFRDGSSGAETYSGGRYVGIDAHAAGVVTVDFNTAQNPWCVYDEEFTCPLPPAENWIAEPIPVGVKAYDPPGQTPAI
jgi:uncharacterized protein (DUF1684 family)